MAALVETSQNEVSGGRSANVTDGRDAHVGFSIVNTHGAPIVTFSYLDRADAVKARTLVEQAIAGVLQVRAASH